MKRMHPVLLIAAGLLLAGVGLAVWSRLHGEAEQPWAPLASRLPMKIDDWQGEDLPLGETEVVRNAVETLNYNDFLYRVYRKEGAEIFVYAMFWRQARISVREMAGHTPDGCWTAGGAKYCVPPRQLSFAVDGRRTLAGEARGFAFSGGQKINVVWWHLWGAESVSREYSIKSVMTMLREIWEWLGRRSGSKRDQLMVRIHGKGAIEELIETPPASLFLSRLPVFVDGTSRPSG